MHNNTSTFTLLLFSLLFFLGISSSSLDAIPISSQFKTIMALPPRAYAERQEMSPIVVGGRVKAVKSNSNSCLVKFSVEVVKRNTSDVTLSQGDTIIIAIDNRQTQCIASSPNRKKSTQSILVSPEQLILIPPIGHFTEAWIRPVPPPNDPNNKFKYFDMPAKTYGFGPNLEP